MISLLSFFSGLSIEGLAFKARCAFYSPLSAFRGINPPVVVTQLCVICPAGFQFGFSVQRRTLEVAAYYLFFHKAERVFYPFSSNSFQKREKREIA